MPDPITLWTLGHSTRTLEELMGLLRERGIQRVVDVRRFPSSRRYPHFNASTLTAALAAHEIEYRHEPDLGGRRPAQPDSPNGFWRVEAFRGYADHMRAPELEAALLRLVATARARSTAILCAEAVPWRCHRQLIADTLVARGHAVRHILAPGQQQEHALRPEARVDAEGRVTYPSAQDRQQVLFGGGTRDE